MNSSHQFVDKSFLSRSQNMEENNRVTMQMWPLTINIQRMMEKVEEGKVKQEEEEEADGGEGRTGGGM